MKKIALWGVILTLVFTLTGCSALENMLAEPSSEPTEGLEYELNEDGQSYSVVGFGTALDSVKAELESIELEDYAAFLENNKIDIVIASTYNDLPVTGIGDSAFDFGIFVSSVTIPDSVTSIGARAFGTCDMENISIPAGVTSIGDSAFSGCDRLTSITIPAGVTSIGDAVFYGCDSLTSITIPAGVTSIGDAVFYGCDSLTSITIPAGVTSIGNSAFYGCENLTSITIPAGVTSIGETAFTDCDSLTDITFQGTQAQWQAFSVAGNFTVTCTDGIIAAES